MTAQTFDKINLLHKSQAELDELYQNSSVGTIPEGDGQGTALFFPGSIVAKVLAFIIRLFVWQGKVFYRDQSFLLNKVSLFRLQAIKAQVYQGESWLCDGEAIVLDYSKTSFLAQKIRDEIREVAPGVYLGQAYWGRTRVLSFVLEF
ncbi:MAG: hypothetical protein ACAF41_31495 [Leptolyngbya sp. BL-A-14]